MSKEVTFHYGALADPLEEQARKQGLTLGKTAKRWQKIYDAMLVVWIHGITTDSQKGSMIKRFQKGMIKDLVPFEESV